MVETIFCYKVSYEKCNAHVLRGLLACHCTSFCSSLKVVYFLWIWNGPSAMKAPQITFSLASRNNSSGLMFFWFILRVLSFGFFCQGGLPLGYCNWQIIWSLRLFLVSAVTNLHVYNIPLQRFRSPSSQWNVLIKICICEGDGKL